MCEGEEGYVEGATILQDQVERAGECYSLDCALQGLAWTHLAEWPSLLVKYFMK